MKTHRAEAKVKFGGLLVYGNAADQLSTVYKSNRFINDQRVNLDTKNGGMSVPGLQVPVANTD